MWRTVVVRLELLRSLLNVDLVGFLMFEYTRNFLTCCKRMLGLDHEFKRGGFLGVEYGGRHVMLTVSTFGVSPPMIRDNLHSALAPAAQSELATIHDALKRLTTKGGDNKKQTLLVGVDYLDRFKGVQVRTSTQLCAQFRAIL